MTSATNVNPEQPSPGKLQTIWQTIRSALAGEYYNYTEGSIGRALILLAIPMVLEMGMESVFVLVDIFFVAKLGSDAVATVGLTESFLTLLFAIAIGLSMGATALVARRIGEGDRAAAQVVAGQVIWVGVTFSAVVGVLGVIYARELLALMGASETVLAGGVRYTQLMLGGSVTILLIFLLNAIFRGAGNAAIAMRALWIANGINIVLDPCLIFGLGPFPEMGVTGAAVATNIGRGVGVCYQLWALSSGSAQLRVRWSDLAWRGKIMLRLLRVSIPAAVQFSIMMTSYLFLMRIIALYGSNAVAGFTIAIRIFAFTFLPAWGLANATATLVGQNLGAKQPDRAEKSVWMAARYNFVFLATVAVIFISVPGFFVSGFTDEPEVVLFATECLRWCSYAYGLFAVGMIVIQAFNGAGDTDTPTLINVVCFWVMQIPLAYVLAEILGYGPRGVFISIAAADSVLAIIAVLVFRRGRWKLREV